MYLLDYTYWKTADTLLRSGYEFIPSSDYSDEIWLEAPGKSPYDMVRLHRKNVDFHQEIVRDANMQAERIEQVRISLNKRSIKVLNLLFSAEAPVDDWEEAIGEPYKKGKASVESALIHTAEFDQGIQRIEASLQTDLAALRHLREDDISYDDVQGVKESFISLLKKKEERRKKEAAFFQNGKPFFTYIFIALQLIMFFLLEINGGSTNTETLVAFGAKENSLIAAGEWWRLVTPIVLHIGLAHLAFNTFALWSIGTAVEKIYGSGRFLLIYLLAGVTGSIASFVFSPYPSAGASGAIFGCLGALLYLAVSNRKLFLKTIGTNIIVIIIINLGFGFAVSNIDNSGHIGGLIGGFLAAGALGLPNTSARAKRIVSAVLLVALGGGFLYYGVHSPAHQQTALVQQAGRLYQDGQYEEVSELLSGEAQQEGASADLLRILAVSDMQIGEYDKAAALLERAIDKEPEDDTSYYNLALLYAEKNEWAKAETAIKTAVKLKPNEQSYKELQEQIERKE
ncbi:rhomboid family intramembrane serine protease [Bacillus atrophaeus]|uniref:rhomboid family intramembrane serine protease n=1 Tax=Bacillus atrophaeus TaxID=1452 RepID=UPI002E20A6FC|nr:rhomboid family intramembrane serine protease [Bacillus atrophaeus]